MLLSTIRFHYQLLLVSLSQHALDSTYFLLNPFLLVIRRLCHFESDSILFNFWIPETLDPDPKTEREVEELNQLLPICTFS
jgi:hypothetical protein